MSFKRLPAVISYDISDNKSRRKVARLLEAWRIDGQYSVAECLLSHKEANELVLQITEHLDESTDSLLLAWLTSPVTTQLAGSAVCGFSQGLVICR